MSNITTREAKNAIRKGYKSDGDVVSELLATLPSEPYCAEGERLYKPGTIKHILCQGGFPYSDIIEADRAIRRLAKSGDEAISLAYAMVNNLEQNFQHNKPGNTEVFNRVKARLGVVK